MKLIRSTNGWTGGQYSVYRAILGLYLTIHFLHLVPWGAELFSSAGVVPDAATSPLTRAFPNVLAVADAPVFVTGLLVVAAFAAMLFAVGYHDRLAAVGLWYVWACLAGRNPLIMNPGIPYIGWLLLAHAFLPRAPFGAWSARGRTDPRGGWHLPAAIHAVAWALMALGYSYSGLTKLVSPSWIDGSAMRHLLENPLARPGVLRDVLLAAPDDLLKLATWGALGLELIFAPLALFRRTRPWIWLLMLLMHFQLMLLVDFVDLSLGMVMLHLFTFDPAWIRPARPGTTDLLFYDGSCGMCHSSVRAVLAEDRGGDSFRFAPLDGEAFGDHFDLERRLELPDSIVLVLSTGEVLTRSRAVLHIAKRLGGLWRALATPAGLLPHFILDRLYDAIAAVRHRVFRRPENSCPITPAELRRRFDS